MERRLRIQGSASKGIMQASSSLDLLYAVYTEILSTAKFHSKLPAKLLLGQHIFSTSLVLRH